MALHEAPPLWQADRAPSSRGRYRCLLEEKERAKITVGKKATKESNRAGCATLLKALPILGRWVHTD